LLEDDSTNMWRCEDSLPNTAVAWRLETVKSDDVVGGSQHAFGFTVLRRGVWAGHPELNAVGKEEPPRGGVVELAPIVALDTLDLAAELSPNKREELNDSQKGVRLQTQRKSPGIM
jgi:hypothetical protein